FAPSWAPTSSYDLTPETDIPPSEAETGVRAASCSRRLRVEHPTRSACPPRTLSGYSNARKKSMSTATTARAGSSSAAARFPSRTRSARNVSRETGGTTATTATTGAARATRSAGSWCSTAMPRDGGCRGGMTEYVELHCHSAFSMLDGAALPELLVARAAELGYPALALTDHDELGGAVRFAQAGLELGIGAIIGAELTVRRKTPSGVDHIVLLAEDRLGYGNLSTLITLARMHSTRGEPSIDLDTLARHAQGVFALTGCPRGWVPGLAASGNIHAACEATATLLDIFDRRVAVECWDHGLPEERETSRHLIAVARALGIPWIVTNDVHYAMARDRVIHDVLACLKHERTLDDMGTRLRPNGEWYLKSAAQLLRRWQHAPDGVRNTLAIAERCQFRMEHLSPTLPAFPLPPGVDADEYLERLVAQGAVERWGAHPPDTAHAQLEHELALIRKLGL